MEGHKIWLFSPAHGHLPAHCSADGTLSYDDLASKHLKWWATDPRDSRSRVTLRHLLTFTSGFMEE